MTEADDAFDIIILIMVLAIFTPIMIYQSIPFLKGDVGGFDVVIEKSAYQTESEIIPEKRQMTTEDVMLMVAVADPFMPEPRAMRISMTSPGMLIPFNDSFFANRMQYLITARTSLPPNQPINAELFSGPSGTRFWNIQP